MEIGKTNEDCQKLREHFVWAILVSLSPVAPKQNCVPVHNLSMTLGISLQIQKLGHDHLMLGCNEQSAKAQLYREKNCTI